MKMPARLEQLRKNKWTYVVLACVLVLLVTYLISPWLMAITIFLAAGGVGWYLNHGRNIEDKLTRILDQEAPAKPAECDVAESKSLVDDMLRQSRSALLLRKQIAGNLSPKQFQATWESLDESMSIVPQGAVALSDEISGPNVDRPGSRRLESVASLYLDRYAVTNRQFFEFVKAGGYSEMGLWDPHVWAAVLDFVDASGEPGPRFWSNGKFPSGEGEHPVVGISWFEANAYARWAGKRLPSDAEWVRAGSWPVPVSDRDVLQRAYPWGDSMDRKRCNLWGTGPGKTVKVDDYAHGVSVGGVYQLIGNVWEWIASEFQPNVGHGQPLILPYPMKTIRGGAFDTYFDNQATCHFRSGEHPFARKHNIGFRCAVNVCDLASTSDGDADYEEREAEDSNQSQHVGAVSQ